MSGASWALRFCSRPKKPNRLYRSAPDENELPPAPLPSSEFPNDIVEDRIRDLILNVKYDRACRDHEANRRVRHISNADEATVQALIAEISLLQANIEALTERIKILESNHDGK